MIKNFAVRNSTFVYYQKNIVRTIKRPPINTTQLKSGRRTGSLGMKVGMLAIWDKWGERHAVTVIHFDDVTVLQVKKEETDGYTALQLGVGERKLNKNTKGTLIGHCKKVGAPPKRRIGEFCVTPDALLPPGQKISVAHFVPGQLVDISGITKGKGFQGGIKRWGMKGGPASHGTSLAHRTIGSTGQRQDPGRVFKNKKMPGRMGGTKVTMQNLKVLKIDPVRQLLYVKGSIPGNPGGFLRIVDAVKGPFYPKPPPFPTFLDTDFKWEEKDLYAPAGEKDKLDYAIPEDLL